MGKGPLRSSRRGAGVVLGPGWLGYGGSPRSRSLQRLWVLHPARHRLSHPFPPLPGLLTQLPWLLVPRRGCGGRGSHCHQPPLCHHYCTAAPAQPGRVQPLRPPRPPPPAAPAQAEGMRQPPPPQGQAAPRPGRVMRHELHPVTYFLGFLESEGEVWAPRRLWGGSALTFPPNLQDAAVGIGWRNLRAPSWEQQSPHAWAAEGEGGRRSGGGGSCWDGATLCPGAGAQHPHWDPRPPRQKLSPWSWCRGALREVRLAGKLDGTPRQEGGRRGRGGRGAPHPRGAPMSCPVLGGARAGCTSRLAPAPPLATASPLLLWKSMRQRRGRPGAKARAVPRRVRMTRAVVHYPEPEGGCEQDQGCLMFRNSPRRREAWGQDGTQSCPTEV